MFLLSTLCLLVISGLVHMATRAIRREKRLLTSMLLLISGITAVVFMGLQFDAMSEMLQGPAMNNGTGKGVAGMVVVLAILHAVHVAGGVVALTVVAIRSWLGRYDHERHWPVDFAAQYWHFLDVVWLCMLLLGSTYSKLLKQQPNAIHGAILREHRLKHQTNQKEHVNTLSCITSPNFVGY